MWCRPPCDDQMVSFRRSTCSSFGSVRRIPRICLILRLALIPHNGLIISDSGLVAGSLPSDSETEIGMFKCWVIGSHQSGSGSGGILGPWCGSGSGGIGGPGGSCLATEAIQILWWWKYLLTLVCSFLPSTGSCLLQVLPLWLGSCAFLLALHALAS
jgi:hypothetical protein